MPPLRQNGKNLYPEDYFILVGKPFSISDQIGQNRKKKKNIQWNPTLRTPAQYGHPLIMRQSIPAVPNPPGPFAHVASPRGWAFVILSRPTRLLSQGI